MTDVKVYEWYYPNPKLTAIHEAGHAYIAWKENFPIANVFITKPYMRHKGQPQKAEGGVDIKGGWVYTSDKAKGQYKIAVAGVAAEFHLCGEEGDAGSGYDLAVAKDLSDMFQLDAEALTDETYDEVEAGKEHILEFARILERKRKLTGRQTYQTFKRICAQPKGI